MSINKVRAEFARRAMQFHANEKLEDITLWGLFSWGAVSKYIKSGQIIANAGYTKENKTIWCKPSKTEIDTFIRPLLLNHSLEELRRLAGW
jgi:hypothetical protein